MERERGGSYFWWVVLYPPRRLVGPPTLGVSLVRLWDPLDLVHEQVVRRRIEQFRALFRPSDADPSGFIDQLEFVNLCQEANPDISAEGGRRVVTPNGRRRHRPKLRKSTKFCSHEYFFAIHFAGSRNDNTRLFTTACEMESHARWVQSSSRSFVFGDSRDTRRTIIAPTFSMGVEVRGIRRPTQHRDSFIVEPLKGVPCTMGALPFAAKKNINYFS